MAGDGDADAGEGAQDKLDVFAVGLGVEGRLDFDAAEGAGGGDVGGVKVVMETV